jgi:hypothetical protein
MIINRIYSKRTMKATLEKIAFDPMEESLKKEIKEDIFNFKLDLYEDEMSAHLYLKSKTDIILNCGRIMEFEYPEESKEQGIKNKGISLPNGYRALNINFLYNNKRYTIQSHI